MTFPGSDPEDFPALPREAREAVEEARQHDRDTYENNDPFALCYLEGMQSDILPSKRRRKISQERREY